jgi:hypothetical protein
MPNTKINSQLIADLSIETEDIKDGAITTSKINIDTDLNLAGKKIVNLADPINSSDAATKAYVDAHTSNQLPPATSGQTLRYDGTAWVADSNLYNDGINIGIGITSPSEKLHVAGNIGIQSGANAFVGTLDNYALSLRTNNTDSIFITNTGNVGIGTTTPDTKLSIIGGRLKVGEGNSSDGYIRLGTTEGSIIGTNGGVSSNYNGLWIGVNETNMNIQADTTLPSWAVDIGGFDNITFQGTSDSFRVARKPAGGSYSEFMRITNNGNVGIGTTNPQNTLDVFGAIRMRNWAGSNNGYVWEPRTDNSYLDLTYRNPTAVYSNIMSINYAGNVGIGTTNPQQRLTLSSNSNFAVEMLIPTGVAISTSTGGILNGTYYYKVSASDGSGWTTLSSEVSATVDGGTTAGTINVSWNAVQGATKYRVWRGTSSGGENQYYETTSTSISDNGSLTFTSGTPPTATTAYVNKITSSGNSWFLGGNVGIGTTNPGSLLSLYNATTTRYAMNIVSFQELDDNSSNSAVGLYIPKGTTLYLGSNNPLNNGRMLIYFSQPNTSGMWTGAYIGSVVGDTSNGGSHIVFGRRTGANTWDETMRIDKTGNVGIGTTSPTEKLDVVGNIRLNGYIKQEFPTSSLSATGTIITITAGENLSAGDVLRIGVDGKYYKANASYNTGVPAVALAIENISASYTGRALVKGYWLDTSKNYQVGKDIYLATVAGGITQTPPTSDGNQIQKLGIALTNNLIEFNPDQIYMEYKAIPYRVDLTNVTTDYLLQVGEEAIIYFSNATSVPLHIQTQSGTYYEIDVLPSNNAGTSGGTSNHIFLNPNNTTYSNAFKYAEVFRNISQFDSHYYTFSSFKIGYAFSKTKMFLENTTTFKSINGISTIYGTSLDDATIASFSTTWIDTTTQWTSLGTITFPQNTSGYILVRRLQ